MRSWRPPIRAGSSIRRDGLEYREMSTDFDQIKEHAVDVFEELQARLGVASFTTPSCRLEARWDLETDGGVPTSLYDQVAGLHRSEVILGSIRAGGRDAAVHRGRSDTRMHLAPVG